jgi:ankyrin repeat protein
MLWAALLLILSGSVAPREDTGARFYQSIRNDNLTVLRTLIKENGVGKADVRGQTPLMLAAAFGSYDAMKLLIDSGADVKAVSASGVTALHLCAGDIKKVRLLLDRGADVNAKSQMGRTPLLVAAFTAGASDTVSLLLSKGADANTADTVGVTPLIAAANVNDTAAVKLLLERGAEVNARADIGQAATPLMAAAHNGNAELARLLLARKASVDAVSAPRAGIVKNGVVAFGSATALHFAALGSNPEVVKLLLDAGAGVDAQDMRGMTPLIWSVSTDRPNVEIIRMLLQKGASTSARSTAGETALDWARKFLNSEVMTELRLEAGPSRTSELPVKRPELTPRTAVERSMPLLQTSVVGMFEDGGCIACHAQPLTNIAVVFARGRGWNVSDAFASDSLHALKTRWMNADQPLLQGLEGGGGLDTLVYDAMALAAAGEPASWNTDVLVHYLIAKQRPEGNWHGVGATRAPIQDGDFSRTAMSIRALTVYGIPARHAETQERIRRAATWLAAQTPLSTEDRIMQLLGLKWANLNTRVRDARTQELVQLQRKDGGWSQTPYLPSDAYATGQVLYTLHDSGLASTDVALKRGVDYLLQTQQSDGSWYVKSRAMKIQPYFQSGFPYEHDQWISAAGTAWAAIGLSATGSQQTHKTSRH